MRYGLCQPPSARMPLEDMLASHLAKVSSSLLFDWLMFS